MIYKSKFFEQYDTLKVSLMIFMIPIPKYGNQCIQYYLYLTNATKTIVNTEILSF